MNQRGMGEKVVVWRGGGGGGGGGGGWSASVGEEDGEECGERVEGVGESGVILGEEGGEGWRERMEEVWMGGVGWRLWVWVER